MDELTTWRKELEAALLAHGESLKDIVGNTMSDEEMAREFDNGYGGSEGIAFTVWTSNRVYFPCRYAGADGVASVSRHPTGEVTEHVGGG